MEYGFLKELGIKKLNSGACVGGLDWAKTSGRKTMASLSPIDGHEIASVALANEEDYEWVLKHAAKAFEEWRVLPAPKRGEIVRQIGDALRANKGPLGKLVTLEMGKILQEGMGEVQEMIDMADFSVGLSRQLYGLTMHSERAGHRMYEQWHPLGIVGIITAFNFPVAVWSWNSFIASVCGDTMVWKPSSQTPLTAIAVQNIVNKVLKTNGHMGVMNLLVGSGSTIGDRLVNDKRVPLISATGSCGMGKRISEAVAKRLGRTLLELGGNNAIIVMDDANLGLAARAVLFGAVGTAGQRCTSTRRIFLHRKIAHEFTNRLLAAYKQVRVGNPLDGKTLMGPLVNGDAVETMMSAIGRIKKEGGAILHGGERLQRLGKCYVTPAIAKAHHAMSIVKDETFAPILYLIEFDNLEDAIRMQNDVPQGLSSSIFTESLKNSELFLSHMGSDCGIANVNIGTSGAEIGGAFGGEKETGGGREAGSDSWKAYMRRQTNTINWSGKLPLSQGIEFEL